MGPETKIFQMGRVIQIISDRTGSVKDDGFLSKEAAQEWAEKWGYSPDEIVWCQLDQIRKEYQKSKKK